jgi:hypothetical protein
LGCQKLLDTVWKWAYQIISWKIWASNLVDLGGFREFINAHDVKKQFVFEVRMPIPKGERFFPSMLTRPLEASKVETMGLRAELG